MVNEYDRIELDSIYIRTKTVYKLAQRDKLIPYPLNVIVYIFGLIIHFLSLSLTIFFPTTFNIYSHFDHSTYRWLKSFDCGCDQYKDDAYNISVPQNAERWNVFLFVNDCVFKECAKKVCCSKCSKKCIDYHEEIPLTVYHKTCYQCITLNINDILNEQYPIHKIRGISMKEYISSFLRRYKLYLHENDKEILKHLNVEMSEITFCDKCYQPFLKQNDEKVLLSPFHVLLDFISCFMFLLVAWFPLLLLFSMFAFIENYIYDDIDHEQSLFDSIQKNASFKENVSNKSKMLKVEKSDKIAINQYDHMLFNGFLIPPILADKSDNLSIKYNRDSIEKLSPSMSEHLSVKKQDDIHSKVLAIKKLSTLNPENECIEDKPLNLMTFMTNDQSMINDTASLQIEQHKNDELNSSELNNILDPQLIADIDKIVMNVWNDKNSMSPFPGFNVFGILYIFLSNYK